MDWCEIYFNDDIIHHNNLTWLPAIIELTSGFVTSCNQLVPLQQLKLRPGYVLRPDLNFADYQTMLANNTMRQYHDTGILAADEFLAFYLWKTERQAKGLDLIATELKQMTLILEKMRSIGCKSSILCVYSLEASPAENPAENCWTTSDHHKRRWDQTAGTWSSKEYNQTLSLRQNRFLHLMWEISGFVHSPLKWALPDFSNNLDSTHRELEARFQHIKSLIADPANNSELIISLLLSVIEHPTSQQTAVKRSITMKRETGGGHLSYASLNITAWITSAASKLMSRAADA